MKKELLRKDGSKYIFYCPGCGFLHAVVEERWHVSGPIEAPTITPSVLNTKPWDKKSDYRCHLFITAGKIRYLEDCSHELAGETIDMIDLNSDY